MAGQALWELAPLLGTMLVLLCASTFFSASEAALFSLRVSERHHLKSGTRAERLAVQLLDDPDRLLSGVLFGNLTVNIAYFALASIVGLRLQRLPEGGTTWFTVFTLGSLLFLIFLGELLPKTLAVLCARSLAARVSRPLSLALRVIEPILPAVRVITLLSRRLVWPRFEPETYLQVVDLDRAIEQSTSDAQLVEQERAVLRNLTALSDLRVDECMRPRAQLLMRRPPVGWRDIQAEYTQHRWLMITERDSDEIVAVVDLNELYELPEEHLEHFAEQVLYAPWCANVADVLQMLESKGRIGVAVVNEMGETIGVMLHNDILDMVFTSRATRSERLFNRQPIVPTGPDEWQVSGMSNLRALEQHFDVELPETPSVTIGGVLQECLQRLPVPGDRCVWGPFEMEVLETPDNEPVVVRLRRAAAAEDET